MAEHSIVRSQQALAQSLARLRYERGLTQEELAETLGVSRRYVWELENAQPNLYATRLFEALRELGAHLEVVPDEARGGGDETHHETHHETHRQSPASTASTAEQR